MINSTSPKVQSGHTKDDKIQHKGIDHLHLTVGSNVLAFEGHTGNNVFDFFPDCDCGEET